MHGEYKTPGGKLVVVDIDVTDGRLAGAMVSGDFFLYPEEALEHIVGALDSLPATATEEQITQAIAEALPDGTEMLGFSPEAIAIAVRRALA